MQKDQEKGSQRFEKSFLSWDADEHKRSELSSTSEFDQTKHFLDNNNPIGYRSYKALVTALDPK